jgi:hypothetical protein
MQLFFYDVMIVMFQRLRSFLNFRHKRFPSLSVLLVVSYNLLNWSCLSESKCIIKIQKLAARGDNEIKDYRNNIGEMRIILATIGNRPG